jgi:tetratricopeptide (TPR) repeat protein
MSLETALEVEIKRQLQEGIKLARAGDKNQAAEVFSRILSVDPDAEDALVWKAAVINDRAEAVRCLQHALKVNPENRRAQAGLDWALRRLEDTSSETAETVEAEPSPTSPVFPPPTKSTPLRLVTTSNPKSETNDEPAPYKKSRFPGKAPEMVLPPEAIPPKPAQVKREKRSGPRFGKAARSSKPAGVIDAAIPKVGISVSEKVRLGDRATNREANPVRIIWPLLLFVLALALALLTFPLSFLAPVLGVGALLITLAGIVLFNRAEF